jgi:type III secretion protein N (ATPase)
MSEPKSVLSDLLNRVEGSQQVQVRGRVKEARGLVLRATVPEAAVGDVVYVRCRAGVRVPAEVVGFDRGSVVLLPLGDIEGIGPGAQVETTGEPLSIRCGEALLGRVVDGLGHPIDGGAGLEALDLEPWPIMRHPPPPLERRRILEPLSVGIRAIDGLLTMGKGQRVGLFAGSGVGKSVLMGQIARGSDAEVNVICLVGERGREVRDFVEDVLGPEGLARSVVVVATSDQPSLIRLKSCFVATAIAEWFREQGRDVLLMMDSATRFARAQREVGLAAGEPPARQGYPPSVFRLLPKLLERAGNSARGTMTAIYTVLVAGGDMEEPIADEVRGIVDGHFVLSRELASRNHWPALDVLHSLSRVMNQVVDGSFADAAGRCREALSVYESKRDLISLGAYQYGSDPDVDYAIDLIDDIEAILTQGMQEFSALEETQRRIMDLFG